MAGQRDGVKEARGAVEAVEQLVCAVHLSFRGWVGLGVAADIEGETEWSEAAEGKAADGAGRCQREGDQQQRNGEGEGHCEDGVEHDWIDDQHGVSPWLVPEI